MSTDASSGVSPAGKDVRRSTAYSVFAASRRTILIVVFLLLVGTVVSIISYLNFNKYHHLVIANEVEDGAGIIKREIVSLKNVVDLLATNPVVVDFDPETTPHQEKIRVLSYLQSLKYAGAIVDAYLLDKDGTCVASSNRGFEGKNYAFRTYFKEAVKNDRGVEFAFGVTSKKVGLYLSQRIDRGPGMGGVAVLKVDPLIILAVAGQVHKHIADGGQQAQVPFTALVSPSGVMVSNEVDGLLVLDSQVVKTLILSDSRQFDTSLVEELGFTPGTWQNLYKNKKIRASFGKDEHKLFIEEVMSGTLLFFHSFSHVQEHSAGTELVLLNRTAGFLGISFLFVFVPLVIFAFSLDRQRFRLNSMNEELSREKRLKDENESRYQAVIDNNRQGFWTINPDTATIESVNQTLCDMLGFSAVELINKTPAELVADDDVPAIIAKSMGGGDHYTLTATMVGSGKKMVPVHIDSRLMRDEDGNPLFRYCFIADLSQEMESLEKIRLLEAVVEQSPSSIVITDIEGTIQYVNPAFSRVTGYSYEEAVGNNPRVLKSGQHDVSVYGDMWKVLSSGETWRGRFCNKAKTDSFYWEEVVIAPVRNEEGIVSNYVAIKNDITERVILEEKLQQKFTERELIVQYAGVGILYIKGENIIEFNEMAARLLAVPSGELILKDTRGLFPSDGEYNSFVDNCFPDLQTGKTVEFEQERANDSGDKIWLRVTGRAVDNDFAGKGVIWIIQDVTSVYSEKKQLERKRQEAEEASNAKTMFLANMSHEIRTPMNAIIGMTRLVSETKLDSEQRRYTERIATASTMLLNIINAILDFSKIEAGQLLLNKHPFVTEQVVDTVYSMMTHLAENKGIVFTITCDDDVPDAFDGDMGRLVQVLVNLVGNGIKFTDQGEVKVRIALQEQQPDLRKVILSFSVEDSGIGIAPDRVESIFHEFQQADSSVSRRFGGTGLGLAISRKLVQLMGGDISVTSREGIGSIFSFTVELETCSLEAVSASVGVEGEKGGAAGQAGSEKNLKVLLVEDNEVNCELATIVLERFGHTVYAAKNGIVALTMLAEERFDVVLMDVQMPEMDGLTATQAIRAVEAEEELPVSLPPQLPLRLKNRLAGQHVPVLAMTAHAMESDRQRCLKAGMDDYLTKPFQPYQLQAAILRFAGGESKVEKNIIYKKEKGKAENGKITVDSGNDTVSMVKKHLAAVYGLGDAQIEQLLTSSGMSINSNIDKAQACLDKGDLKTLASAAHALKGSFLNLGLTSPAEAAAKIEVAVGNGEPQPYGQLLADIRKGVAGLLDIGRSG